MIDAPLLLRKWGIGKVVEHKVIGQNQVLILPLEILPQSSPGIMKSDPTVLETKGTNDNGEEYQSKALSTGVIPAEWLPEGNRFTSPDVRRDTRVEIWRLGDTDQYYWRDLGLDRELKRLETVIWVFNNNPNEKAPNKVDLRNSYYLEISTHNKVITLHTSTSNGEAVEHVIQLNAAESRLTYATSDGSEAVYDTGNQHFYMLLATGTTFGLEQNDIYAFAPGNMRIEAKGNIDVECQQYSVRAHQSYRCETQNWYVDAPVGTFTGVLTVGALSTTMDTGQSGHAVVKGSMEIQQDLAVQSTATVAGRVTAGQVVSQQPIIAPNVD